MSNDLLKLSAKIPKSSLAAKAKYTVDIPHLKQIIKGHGTNAFAKSKGIFRRSN